MKSVINELYNGEISPVETETPRDEKYRCTVNRVGQEIEELEELLTKEQYKKLEHMMDMNAEIFNMENRAVFAEGLRLGILLMVEIYRMDEHRER